MLLASRLSEVIRAYYTCNLPARIRRGVRGLQLYDHDARGATHYTKFEPNGVDPTRRYSLPRKPQFQHFIYGISRR